MDSPDSTKITELLTKAAEDDVFKLAVQNAFNHIIITNTEGIIVFANSAVERITGYALPEVIGKTPKVWGGQMDSSVYKAMWHTIKDKRKPYEGEFNNKKKNGQIYTAKAIISPIIDESSELIGFIGTEEDITKEKEVDKMKTEFISITAHQLKTPMTSLSWHLEIVEDKLKDSNDNDLRTSLSFIKKTNGDLIALVDNLLNISRIESGRLSTLPKYRQMEDVCNELLLEFKDLAAKKHIELKSSCTGKIEIMLDDNLVKHAIRNLLSNSIKYSPNDSTIEVGYTFGDVNVEIFVKDNGYGIPEADRDKVFNKHFRGSNVKNMVEGTGLGLYFVKLIIESYGGSIRFEPNSPQGTCFYFTIPKAGMNPKEGEVSLS